jgi:hypothetical protein
VNQPGFNVTLPPSRVKLPDGVSFPKGCFGVNPKRVHGPVACGLDIRPTSYDTAVIELISLPGDTTGTLVPRLVFYGKVPDERTGIYLIRQYRARAVVADSAPDFTVVRRMAQAVNWWGVKMWRAQYLTTPSQVKIAENADEGILKLERTLSLDDVWWKFHTKGILVPQNFRDICGGKFVTELTSSTKIETPWQNGGTRMRWDKAGDDHVFHALGYALAAAEWGNIARFGGGSLVGPTKGLVASTIDQSMDDADSVFGTDSGSDSSSADGCFLEA